MSLSAEIHAISVRPAVDIQEIPMGDRELASYWELAETLACVELLLVTSDAVARLFDRDPVFLTHSLGEELPVGVPAQILTTECPKPMFVWHWG